jgi:hypothetical protein
MVAGYELNPQPGYFGVIIPEATTNLVTNPSFEGNVTTGYTASGAGAVIAAIATWQAYGAYGLRITPGASVESGAYYGTVSLTAGTDYTASVTLQGEAGKTYYIWFATTAGALLGTKRKWIGTGHKQRIHVTYTETSSTTRRVYVTRDAAYADTHYFYIDGLQVEAKAYPTTFCDGDQTGFVVGEVAYYWNGTPRASTSSRSAQTRAGGREMSLLSYGFRVLAVIGLGMAALVDQALAIPGFGELPQGTGTQAREFSLVGALVADSDNPRLLMAQREDLIDAFKPDLVTRDQPMILTFQGCDDEGEALGDKVEIVCKYRGGLEGNWDNHQGERLALNFKQYMPMIRGAWDTGTTLGFQTTVADSDLVMRRINGIWYNVSTDFNTSVYKISKGRDGYIYVGGGFTNVGDANGDRIVGWTGSALFSLGTGIPDGLALAIVFDAAGTLYVGGTFSAVGGVANTESVAQWNGAAWSELGGGIVGDVYTLLVASNGYIYVGGGFTDHGDADGDYITMWNGAAWVSLGTGMNGAVYSLAEGPDGSIYAGGTFTTAGGVTVNGIAKWDGTAWTALSTGMAGTAGIGVYALVFDDAGNLYAGGAFDHSGGIVTNMVARWNGVVWSALKGGMTNTLAAAQVTALAYKDGLLYAGGSFDNAGGVDLPESVALWNGSNWLPIDVNLPSTPNVETILIEGPTDNLWLGYSATGNAISATVTASNAGSASVYPKVTFTGPGTVWQLKNYTTGKGIYFDLTLLAGETAVLNLDPTAISFVSSFRGNILSTILPGSDLNFELLPGANNVSSYIYGGTTAASAIVMSWRDQYWSLDGAIWK